MTSPLVTHEKLRSECSSTARRLVISKKSTCCGCNLTDVALGNDTLWNNTTDTSSMSKFYII